MSSSPIDDATPVSKPRKKIYKSWNALRLEREAIEAFHKYLETHGTPTVERTIVLLQPSHHLTHACWKDFSHHVKSVPGWLAKRRLATPEEKLADEKTRNVYDKVYWTDIKYQPSRAKRMAADAAIALHSSKRPANNDDDMVEPTPSKKVKAIPQVVDL